MSLLTKDAILAVADMTRETVAVPEWGGEVCVRAMSGSERDAFESHCFANKDQPFLNARAKLASLCVCDDAGARLFTDSDVAALSAKSAAALDRIYDVAIRLSRMRKEDLETSEKN